ncbi:MAG: hypothetical protein JNL97_07385 [Verrucomicrobiales bacterium]|nr:hypothetical protein [Verrucomicrobiales bacterium]
MLYLRSGLGVGALLATTLLTRANLLTIDSVIGGVPTGVNYLNFNDLSVGAQGAMKTAGNADVVVVTVSGNAGVVTGAKSGKYAAPYLSNDQGSLFDGHKDGVDTSVYLTTGSTSGGGAIRLDFSHDQRYLGLLWGSVDSYNKLAFYDASDNLLGFITGRDVLSSPVGDQGAKGTAYVNILSEKPFDHVIASSDGFAFEFDNVAYNQRPLNVPDNGYSFLLLGVGAAGVACWRRWARPVATVAAVEMRSAPGA